MAEVTVRGTKPFQDQVRSLNRYIVEVNGERVGIVGQHLIDAIKTRWFWQADEPLGGADFEFPTRQSAIDDLVGYVVSLSEGVLE